MIKNIVELTPFDYSPNRIEFFLPKEEFFQEIDKLNDGKLIIDVGTGTGKIPVLLVSRGHAAIGIDTHTDSLNHVVLANGAIFPYPNHSITMFCRPCHGPFVEGCIEYMLLRRVSNIIYVGLKQNMKHDLNRFAKNFELIATNVGEEKESMLVWNVNQRI